MEEQKNKAEEKRLEIEAERAKAEGEQKKLQHGRGAEEKRLEA